MRAQECAMVAAMELPQHRTLPLPALVKQDAQDAL